MPPLQDYSNILDLYAAIVVFWVITGNQMQIY